MVELRPEIRTVIPRVIPSAPSHSHDSSGNDAPSLIPNPATPAKAGAHWKSGSRPSPGKRGGDVELHQLHESVPQKDLAALMARTSALRSRAEIRPSMPSVFRMAANSERRVATSLIAPSR